MNRAVRRILPGRPAPRARRAAALAVALAALAAGAAPSRALPAEGAAAADAPSAPETLQRNPFWPVGFEPGAAPAVPSALPFDAPRPRVGPLDWDAATRSLDIRGVTSLGAGRSAAIINGEVVSEGESLTLRRDGWIYAWRVERIRLDNVELTRLDARVEYSDELPASLRPPPAAPGQGAGAEDRPPAPPLPGEQRSNRQRESEAGPP